MEGKGAGPHTSECISSKGAEYTVDEERKGKFWDLPIQQDEQTESEMWKGILQAFKTLETISAEGWPSLKCQSLNVASPFAEAKKECGVEATECTGPKE